MRVRYGIGFAVVLLLLGVSPVLPGVINVPADYATIQEAIDAAAAAGDTIQVAAGTYYENLVWDSKSIGLVGAGAGTTTVDGGGLGSCLAMTDVPASASVEGFTFSGGSGTWDPVLKRTQGGGVYLYGSSPTLTGNVISGNAVDWPGYGGGVWMGASYPTLVDNTISGNSADGDGGGVYVYRSSPTLTGNTISDNWAEFVGGGLYAMVSSGTLSSNTISDNMANFYGGGMHLWSSSPTLTGNVLAGNGSARGGGGDVWLSSPTLSNNVITGNSAGQGGGLNLRMSSPTLTNNTIAENTGGGLYQNPSSAGSPVITNCILWGNTAGDDLSGASATYSDIGTGELVGEGNIWTDPVFVGDGDYHLQGGSPCTDAGTNDAPNLPDTDKDGNPRIYPEGGVVDMGAYERQQVCPFVVQIDIKPGSYPNSINLGSKGKVPVAVLSATDFDATTVDPATVALAGAGTAIRGKGALMSSEQDVDGDGLVDLIVHVATENLNPDELQDGLARLTAETYEGLYIEGQDEITIVPPE